MIYVLLSNTASTLPRNGVAIETGTNRKGRSVCSWSWVSPFIPLSFLFTLRFLVSHLSPSRGVLSNVLQEFRTLQRYWMMDFGPIFIQPCVGF